MYSNTVEVNNAVSFLAISTTGLNPPTDLVLFKDSAVYTGAAVTVVSASSSNAYNFTFTPIATGTYTVFAYGAIQATVFVVSKSLFTYMKNVEDESLGSWSWDKTAGTLSLLRQDGTPLASFNVTDTLTTATRERI